MAGQSGDGGSGSGEEQEKINCRTHITVMAGGEKSLVELCMFCRYVRVRSENKPRGEWFPPRWFARASKESVSYMLELMGVPLADDALDAARSDVLGFLDALVKAENLHI